jgi:hypothetical protein
VNFFEAFPTAARIFVERPPRSPATELLINFNASGLRRFAGLLTSQVANEVKEKTLGRMDEVCGGQWWRQVWLEHAGNSDAAEAAVVNEYARRLAREQQCGLWTTPVRNHAHQKPAYHLVFLSRHPEGLCVFGEALSLGLEKWRRAIHEIDFADSLFGDEESFKASEDVLTTRWTREIEENLRRLLREGEPFRVVDRYAEVYGSATGQARLTHLRTAWRRLYPSVTQTDSRGKDLLTKLIEPA